MLANYYHTKGMYTLPSTDSSNSSSSSMTSSESSSADERKDDHTSTHNTGNTGNSFLLKLKVHATAHIDVKQFFVASTNDCNLSEYITTASELWTSSSSALSSTSEYLSEQMPSFSQLLDYSPTYAEQPQPTDAILVPKEAMWDPKLRCPPTVEIARSTMVENLIRSFQDHLPPSMEDQDIIIINSSPEYLSETSDSDVICLD